MYDVTLRGSLLDSGNTPEDAITRAKQISEAVYPGRLIRVHGVDGAEVIAEIRNGELEDALAL
jgi:hypothetical protein